MTAPARSKSFPADAARPVKLLSLAAQTVLGQIGASPAGVLSRLALGQQTGLPKSTIASALNELETQGYVERKMSGMDARTALAQITNQGRRGLAEARDP